MRHMWMAVAGWALVVNAGAQPAEAPSAVTGTLSRLALPNRHLGLVYADVAKAVPFAFPGLSREVESILQRQGVSVRWRPWGPGVVASDGEMNVVLLNSQGGGALDRHVMGATRLDDGVTRTVWIYVPSVAQTLAVDLQRWALWSEAERDLFATALGRVVAHEIFHALAPDLPHLPGGLMAERLDRARLVGPWVELPAEFRGALRPTLRAGSPPASSEPRCQTARQCVGVGVAR